MGSVEVEKEIEMEVRRVRSWNRVPCEIPVEPRDKKGPQRRGRGLGDFKK
jgi:hypothetical protein